MGPLKARLAVTQHAEPQAREAEALATAVEAWSRYPIPIEAQQAVQEAVKALRSAATHLRAAKAAL